MALASLKLVTALRSTAARLREGSSYQWGHLGMCNCGHLVQTVCAIPPQQIHRVALSDREGDWEQLANAYCPTSGFPIDDVIGDRRETNRFGRTARGLRQITRDERLQALNCFLKDLLA